MENQENVCSECQDCLKVLQIVLDDEATPEEVALVHEHINRCAHCLDCYETDKSLKEAVKKKIKKPNTPTDLIDCIKEKLATIIK